MDNNQKVICSRCGKSDARYSVWINDETYDYNRTHLSDYWYRTFQLYNICEKCHNELVDWFFKGGAVQKFSDSLWKDFCEEHGVEYNV